MNILRMILIIIFLISALAVTIIVLLQEGKSAGLGVMTNSNSGNSYWERNKKHSLEGKFEQWTKITAVVFVLSAFLIMLIPTGNTTNINTQDPMDTILPAPVDGGNENVDANGQPKVDNATNNAVTPETNGVTNATVAPEANGATNNAVIPETNETANNAVTPETNGAANNTVAPEANGAVNNAVAPATNTTVTPEANGTANATATPETVTP